MTFSPFDRVPTAQLVPRWSPWGPRVIPVPWQKLPGRRGACLAAAVTLARAKGRQNSHLDCRGFYLGGRSQSWVGPAAWSENDRRAGLAGGAHAAGRPPPALAGPRLPRLPSPRDRALPEGGTGVQLNSHPRARWRGGAGGRVCAGTQAPGCSGPLSPSWAHGTCGSRAQGQPGLLVAVSPL